jgi:PAS domain S-box-containing protein
MLKRDTLKHKLILGGIAAVFIPFLIASIIIYIQLSNSLLEITEEKAISIASDTSALIYATLMPEIKLADSIAADPEVVRASKSGDYRNAQQKLEALYKRIGKKVFTIFLTDKEGIARAEAVFKEQIGLDLSDRQYFKRAKQGKHSISGPIFAKGTATPNNLIIVVSVPIQDNGEFLGMVCLPFDSDFTSKIIGRKKAGKTGHAFLISREGTVLIHPRQEYNLKLRLFDQPGTDDLKKAIMSKSQGSASYSFKGTESIAGFSKVEPTGWTAVFSQSRDEIMTPVNHILSSLFLGAVVFLCITVAAIVVFSSKISSPIQKMMEVMRQITRHSSEMILQIGSDRKIIFANPAYEKITGLESDDLIGTVPGFNSINNVPDSLIWETLKKGNSWSGRIMVKGQAPEPITLDAMLVPFRDERGVTQGYLEIGHDVSAELRYEKRLQQTQKLEAIGTLAGGIAHDFNNILSGVFGYAELSLMKGNSKEETQSYIRQIIVGAERARDLVNQILTFSRKTQVELRPLIPKLVIKETIKLLRASIPASIDIQASINSDAAVMAEPTQIHQVIMNLFTNATHAIGDNTGSIKLELEDFMVDERFTKTHPNITQGKHIALRVSDTGGGIAPDILERIFEPFFTTKSQSKGTGLGLSVVHGIVQKLGGIITVYSRVGEGTTFNVFIPCIELNPQELEETHYQVARGSERIVIVDDEVAITITLRHILTELGYKVTAFTDSMEALQAIKADPAGFDLLITDYSMPQLTGLELVLQLRNNDNLLPVILISGYFGENLEAEARKAGITEMVAKPLNTYQLSDAIQRLLAQTKPDPKS